MTPAAKFNHWVHAVWTSERLRPRRTPELCLRAPAGAGVLGELGACRPGDGGVGVEGEGAEGVCVDYALQLTNIAAQPAGPERAHYPATIMASSPPATEKERPSRLRFARPPVRGPPRPMDAAFLQLARPISGRDAASGKDASRWVVLNAT